MYPIILCLNLGPTALHVIYIDNTEVTGPGLGSTVHCMFQIYISKKLYLPPCQYRCKEMVERYTILRIWDFKYCVFLILILYFNCRLFTKRFIDIAFKYNLSLHLWQDHSLPPLSEVWPYEEDITNTTTTTAPFNVRGHP